jgi:cobaltochelatase CobS
MRINLYLHGPAGTGKSFIAEQIANALDLPFGCMSFCGQSTKTDLVGYMDAHGKYVSTVFYDIYKNGGIFCLDEMDAANPNLINLLNGGLAGGQMSFPCGMVKRHPDFVCVASANTFGTGSTEQYIGRNPLDAASLDRFQKVTIDYCQNLERGLYSATACEMVWEERKRLQGRTGYVLSMRTIGRIDLYLAAGYSASEAYEMAINSHLNQNLRK